MTDLIKTLTDQKAKHEDEITRLKGLIFDEKIRVKSIEKAIKALDTTKKEGE